MQKKDNDLFNDENNKNNENRKDKKKKEKDINKKNNFSKTFISSVSDFTQSIPKIEVESGRDYKRKKEQSMTEREKRRYKKRKQKRKRIIIFTIFCISLVSVFGIYTVWNTFQETSIFDKNKLMSTEKSIMVDANGETYYSYGSDESGTRENVQYSDIPQILVDAVIATEDSRFFVNNGFDLPRIVKALATNIVKGHISSGGSTITQQLIKKSYYPNAEQTYKRKMGEVILATQATREMTKEEIITSYLNKIYFGKSTQSIGIQSACKYYFNKSVNELTLPEAAMIAGVLNAPSAYDPYYNLSLCKKRRNTVLHLMVKHGFITQKEADAAKSVTIESLLNKGTFDTGYSGSYKDYISIVDEEVEKLTGLNPKKTELVIHTYLDKDLQNYCYQKAQYNSDAFPDNSMEVGAAIQESKTGRLTAVIGGRNTELFGSNRATEKQQPGSSFKPIIDYGMAFEYLGWNTNHIVEDKPFSKGNWNPKNHDNSLHGSMSISEALKQSWNLPAIWALNDVVNSVGWAPVFKTLENYGVDMSKEKENLTLSIGGWAYGVSPVEASNAYSTIVNNGKNIQSHTISYIEVVATGEIINIDEYLNSKSIQAIKEETAQKIRSVMFEYAGQGSYSLISDLPETAAKTGTTNNSRDIWMDSYNPDYCVSVWTGYKDHSSMAGKSKYGHQLMHDLQKYALDHNGGLQNAY